MIWKIAQLLCGGWTQMWGMMWEIRIAVSRLLQVVRGQMGMAILRVVAMRMEKVEDI